MGSNAFTENEKIICKIVFIEEESPLNFGFTECEGLTKY